MSTVFWRIFLMIFLTSNGRNFSIANHDKSENDFREFMDELQNPCKNFYGYACGNWKSSLRETTRDFRYLEDYLKQQYNQILANGFEKRLQEKAMDTNEVYRKAQGFYNSCRNTLDFKVFQYVDVLRTGNAEFHWLEILHNSNFTLSKDNWNWIKTLGLLRSYGFNNALMSMTVTRISSIESLVQFHKPSKIEFDSKETVALEPLEPEFKSKVMKFKQQLISASINDDHVLMNSTDLQEIFVAQDINSYLEMLSVPLPKDKFQFQIEDIPYMGALQKIVNETPLNVVAYFVGVKFVSYLREQLPKSSEIIDCLDPIRIQMPEMLNFLYSERIFSTIQREKTDKILNEIFRQLKIQFLKLFAKNSANLDDTALRFMQEKLFAMQLNIGQIPLNVDTNFYENYFKELRIETENLDSFYRNHLNLMRFCVSKQLRLMDLEATNPNYIFFDLKKGPSLDPYANLVIYPFSLLRIPIFNADEDEIFHYAGIASIMAHDMSHGFDTCGLNIDSEGNPSELFIDILKKNEHIQKALSCIRKQTNTRVDEKIADFVGSRIAYDAYFEKVKEDNFEMPFNLTRKQIFFIKFSQFYCVTDLQSTNDEPMKWLSQIVENNEEFYEAFNCAKQKNYEVCRFW